MNTSKILSSALIAAAAFSASGAFASDLNNYPPEVAQTSTLSRAQVHADLAQAQRAGTLIKADDAYPGNVDVAGSVLSRDQVKAELRDAQHEGSYSQRIDNNYPGDLGQGGSNLNLRS